jgi:hypothetical protein
MDGSPGITPEESPEVRAASSEERAAGSSVVAAAWGMGSASARAAKLALRRRVLVNMMIIVLEDYELKIRRYRELQVTTSW